jgi:hypothetical protein
VHELQVAAAGTIPAAGHDVPLDFIVTPDRVIDCRRAGPRPAAGIDWDDLTEEKIAAIPPAGSSAEGGPGIQVAAVQPVVHPAPVRLIRDGGAFLNTTSSSATNRTSSTVGFPARASRAHLRAE